MSWSWFWLGILSGILTVYGALVIMASKKPLKKKTKPEKKLGGRTPILDMYGRRIDDEAMEAVLNAMMECNDGGMIVGETDAHGRVQVQILKAPEGDQ